MGDGAQQANRGFQPNADAYITFEDQQRINQFARCNAKNDDIKAELQTKKNELQNLEDAVEELVLFDEDAGTIPYLQGEVFMCLNLRDTNVSKLKRLEKAKKKVSDEIRELEEISEELKSVMSGLKTQLYAKFGNHINLEEEE